MKYAFQLRPSFLDGLCDCVVVFDDDTILARKLHTEPKILPGILPIEVFSYLVSTYCHG